MIKIKENILLSEYTTIKLGGRAKYFVECNSEKEVVEGLEYANKNKLKIQLLGDGSNTIFPDEGYDGLIIKIGIKGISLHNKIKDKVILKAGGGETWDDFVNYCVKNNLTGVECLAGIPGNVGATPIQNVGAYGQEVKDTILFVKAISRETHIPTMFSNEDCLFDYRQSRFKDLDKDKYIITEVMFRLFKNGKPEIIYPELKKYIEQKYNSKMISLRQIKESVIELRKNKSMVIDKNDPNSISCGSFFVNPVLTKEELQKTQSYYNSTNQTYNISEIPYYETENGIKISAAWLIENTGFPRGFKKNGIGISEHHNLALINCGGTTKNLLQLADEIRTGVYEKFKINLEPEPVIVKN